MPPFIHDLARILGRRPLSEAEVLRRKAEILAEAPVPVLWLFGKAGSGKTSIARYLTGATDAEIGDGYRPKTTRSRQYDFPSPEAPVLRLVDTRGLGETRYDPTQDIEAFDDQAHVVVVVARVTDHALAEIVEPLRAIRAAKPARPVVLALTWLHAAYPGRGHPSPDPFGDGGALEGEVSAEYDGLRRHLELQTERFDGLVDHVVPIDLTRPEEGFDDPDFGGERLKAAILDALPDAYRQTLLDLDAATGSLRDLNRRRAVPYVLGYATLAATAAAVPAPWVDIPLVAGLQTHMARRLARLYEQDTSVANLLEIGGGIGARILARMALRGPIKAIPFVGIPANAGLTFAHTYALGLSLCWYLGEVRAGNAPSRDEIAVVFKDELAVARRVWKERGARGGAS